MFAYFSADTDEAQVMQHTRPAPRPLLPISSSLTAMNFIFFLLFTTASSGKVRRLSAN